MDGSAILLWRESRGWSQRRLAAVATTARGAKIRQGQISRWENGEPMSAATSALFERLMRKYPEKRRTARAA
jgi:transcriptional regulator with XRE-family HTH domain